jgi:transglutaminase-like putative cysteine protease
VEVIVTRQSRDKGSVERGSLKSDELAEYLEGNLMINTDDPALIALARKAAAGETEAYALGDRLRRFVSEYVDAKTLSIGFATASEVCRTKEGDCSEHGVLLAALGRLNNLPSRVVVGLAYVPFFGGRSDIFGYHMWTQFYIDGQWVDFDAALRESECSPTRIAFAVSSLQSAGLADLSLPMLSKIGAIDIDILDVETGPVP